MKYQAAFTDLQCQWLVWSRGGLPCGRPHRHGPGHGSLPGPAAVGRLLNVAAATHKRDAWLSCPASSQPVAGCTVVFSSAWLHARSVQQCRPGWLGARPSNVEPECGKYRHGDHHHHLARSAARPDWKHCYQWQHCPTGMMINAHKNQKVTWSTHHTVE